MNLKHLEYFVAVNKHGSINKAAQALYVSQPHLSHIIKDIEDDVGKKLLMRAQHGVVLTPEGEGFLRHSQNILSEMRQLRGMFDQPKLSARTFFVSMTKFSHVMESFIDVCKAQHDLEAFTYRLNEGSTIEVIEDVENGAADIGVIHFEKSSDEQYRRMLTEKKLEYHPLSTVRPHIVISKEHPLLRQNLPVTLDAMERYGFVRYIGQYEDFIYNITVNGQPRDLALSPRIVYTYGRATLLHLIAATDFYTIGIQDFSAQQQAYNVVSMPVPDCGNELEFGYILPKGASKCPAVELFVDRLRSRL